MSEQKRTLTGCSLTILGDSYSTFEGHIPEGNYVYYPRPAMVDDVLAVEETWWHQLIGERSLRLLINESSSGTTVCTTVRPAQAVKDAFVSRMKRSLSAQGINGETPDCILLFGGTNDSWIDVPIGALQYENWTEEDLKSMLPAYCYMVAWVQEQNPQAEIFCILNTDLKPEIRSGMAEAAAHYGVHTVALHDIDKQNGHPSKLGMQQIMRQVSEAMDAAEQA